jgi:hypothetical protein
MCTKQLFILFWAVIVQWMIRLYNETNKGPLYDLYIQRLWNLVKTNEKWHFSVAVTVTVKWMFTNMRKDFKIGDSMVLKRGHFGN